MAGGTGSSCKQRKTGSSHWGTPCCTYRYHMWILAGCVLFRGAPCFLFCLIFPYSAVLFSLPTDCKRRRSPRTPRTQTTLFRSKISNALMTQSSLLARREFFRTSPHYKSAPIRSFCDFEQRASPKNHQKVELHKTSLQSCRVLL